MGSCALPLFGQLACWTCKAHFLFACRTRLSLQSSPLFRSPSISGVAALPSAVCSLTDPAPVTPGCVPGNRTMVTSERRQQASRLQQRSAASPRPSGATRDREPGASEAVAADGRAGCARSPTTRRRRLAVRVAQWSMQLKRFRARSSTRRVCGRVVGRKGRARARSAACLFAGVCGGGVCGVCACMLVSLVVVVLEVWGQAQ